MELSVQDLSAITVAFATVIYTGGTFLLWWVNRKNVQVLEKQLLILKDQIGYQSTFNKVLVTNAALDSHREIWLPIITNPMLVGLLQNNNPKAIERTTAEFLGSILINHCARIYLSFQHGFADMNEFPSFSRDARYLFSFPLVRWRWESISKYHSPDFVKFVQDQIAS